MARTLQDLINATQGGKSVGPKGPDPFGRGNGPPAGAGMPYGIPLSEGALAGKAPTPFQGLGNYTPPPQVASSPIYDARNNVRASAPNPFEAYGGAFGGVNQNDLYRKQAPPAAGPNGMMGPAPNFDFNAQARSQVGGQGAALAASKPWEGAFGDAWRRSTDAEFRVLADADKRKDPRTGGKRPSLFGPMPKNPDGSPIKREAYNPETGVSVGYPGGVTEWGQTTDPVVMQMGVPFQDQYAAMSDAELARSGAAANLSVTHRKLIDEELARRKKKK